MSLAMYLITRSVPANANDTTQVKVYLISSLNRVTFIFVNTLEEVEAHRDFVSISYLLLPSPTAHQKLEIN